MLSKNKNFDLTMLRNNKYNIAAMEGLGMKWYKFNIYFRLFFSIITMLSDIASVSANSWGISWNIDTYLCFAIVFDVIMIVAIILTRHWLAHFNKKGVQCYFISQYLSQIVLSVVIFCLLGFNEYTLQQTLPRLITYGIFFALEYKYWKKRIHLFDNSKQSTNTYAEEGDSSRTEAPQLNKFTVCIYDEVSHNVRKEERAVDVNKFPPEKYAVDGLYYAVEKMNKDKKVRVYYTKSNWQIYVDNQSADSDRIKFCRKCGFELIDDSDFCSQCGTKIIK